VTSLWRQSTSRKFLHDETAAGAFQSIRKGRISVFELSLTHPHRNRLSVQWFSHFVCARSPLCCELGLLKIFLNSFWRVLR
jgi:hypothetical protein